ncbi:MAG: DedA family protein [Candidatus Marinimicrobia bacterium]|nr:DedA family protein [Candidatus Neomarinimicrobiota bacterium]
MDFFHSVLEFFSQLQPIHYMLLVLLAYFIENIFPPLPGDTMLVFTAYMFGLYFGRNEFIWLYVFSIAGAVAGFMMMVMLGHHFGRQFFVEKNFRFAKNDFMLKTEAYMDKYGTLVILGNRIFFGLRPVIGLVSGMSKLKWYHTLTLVTISSMAFNAAFIFLGYILGENWELIESILKKYSIFTIIALIALIVFTVIRIRKHEPKT